MGGRASEEEIERQMLDIFFLLIELQEGMWKWSIVVRMT